MPYPGTNTLTLSEQALMTLVQTALSGLLSGVRVTGIQRVYPAGLQVSFTSDPEPVPTGDVTEVAS